MDGGMGCSIVLPQLEQANQDQAMNVAVLAP
jgi:hypothetical protein